jgi:C2 domain-containing protein 3
MGSLTLDLMSGPNSEVIGQAAVTQIGLLTNSRPINGFFPVMSANSQKLANLQVSVVLEPLLASYDNMGAIPTTDISVENGRNYDSMVLPVNSHPLPYSDLIKRPDNTIFVSPPSVNDVGRQAEFGKTYNDGGFRQQLSYGHPVASASTGLQHRPDTGAVAITTSGDVVSLPESRSVGSGGGLIASSVARSNTPSNRGSKSPTRPTSKDLLSVLVNKGTKLREAMIVSSMHADVNANHSNRTAKIYSDKTNNCTI